MNEWPVDADEFRKVFADHTNELAALERRSAWSRSAADDAREDALRRKLVEMRRHLRWLDRVAPVAA